MSKYTFIKHCIYCHNKIYKDQHNIAHNPEGSLHHCHQSKLDKWFGQLTLDVSLSTNQFTEHSVVLTPELQQFGFEHWVCQLEPNRHIIQLKDKAQFEVTIGNVKEAKEGSDKLLFEIAKVTQKDLAHFSLLPVKTAIEFAYLKIDQKGKVKRKRKKKFLHLLRLQNNKLKQNSILK